MMTAEEIVDLYRETIRNMYSLPHTYVRDLGELDHALSQLHWLYAHATARMDDFVAAEKSEPRELFLRFVALTQSHEAIGESDATQQIIDRWKARGHFIGLTM